jgi:hypothetical protein
MIRKDYLGFFYRLSEYSWERMLHFISDITLIGTIQFFLGLTEMTIVLLCEEDGKLSLLNPVFTGLLTFFLESIVILLQWVFECWPSNWWLRGNIFAILDHMFGGMQFVLSFFLLMDF